MSLFNLITDGAVIEFYKTGDILWIITTKANDLDFYVETYIDKEQAEQIIDHLQEQFNLKQT